ncbi:hypothetical protein QBC45DRAFT_361990 [Copromyces sp. CBS 386.78]|nr:hypothetical protein QBC45DRAFT_361990 [Copromyces sp. CBS 386.78]
MLPLIDNSVLENNPQFANLYKGLTELLLNGDGSTKLAPQNPVAQEREAVTEELNKHRLKAAEETLLIHALSTTGPDLVPIPVEQPDSKLQKSIPGGLPVQRRFERQRLTQPPPPPASIPPNLKQPLTDLLLLLPSFLSLDLTSPDSEQPPPLDAESLALILTSPPLSQLPSLLPHIGPLLSATLHSRALELAHIVIRLSHPPASINTTTTSNTHRQISHLSAQISCLISETRPMLEASVLKSRLAIAEAARDLLSKYTVALSHLVKTLEAKHGPVARSLEFKASETALLAAKAEKECEVVVLGVKKEVYTPEVRRALGSCREWLVGEQKRVGEEIERGSELLGLYGVMVGEGGDPEKERVMREIARVYGEMEREVHVVRRDLERLGRV